MRDSSMIFTPPQKRKGTMLVPVFVKGKGLPKSGISVAYDGEDVIVHTDNGAEWYIYANYRGISMKIRVIPGVTCKF